MSMGRMMAGKPETEKRMLIPTPLIPDRINGYGGNDLLIAGAGDDTLNGGTGNDTRRRTRAATINGGKAANDELANAWRVVA